MKDPSQSAVPIAIGRHETALGAPPWFWFWAATFALYLPLTAAGWAQAVGQVRELIVTADKMGVAGSSASRWAFLMMLPGVLVEHIPSMAFALGLLTILFPRLRASYLERRWRLTDPPREAGTLAEIEEFLRARMTGLRLKANLAVPGALLFVYPAELRQTNVAVFGGFAVLWKSDRAAAEAVLIHEAVHQRRGDALFMGPASFFENTVKLALLFYVLFIALPSAAGSLGGMLESIASHRELAKLTAQINEMRRQMGLEELNQPGFVGILLPQIGIGLVGLLSVTFAFLTRLAASFAVPLAGVWTAELNADLGVALGYDPEALRRAIGRHAGRPSFWRRLLFRLSHPPVRMRQWFLRHAPARLLLFLLLFPIAYFVRLVLLHLWASLALQGIGLAEVIAGQETGGPGESFISQLVTNTKYFLGGMWGQWLLMTGVLLLWPLVAGRWEAIFGGADPRLRSADEATAGAHENTPGARSSLNSKPTAPREGRSMKYGLYALAAIFTGTIFIVSFLLRE